MSVAVLEQYYRENYPVLVKRYKRALGSEQAAEDVTQEAFTRCLRYIDRYDSSQPFGPWFAIILRNAFRDQLNIEKGIVFEEFDEFRFEHPDSDEGYQELLNALQVAIKEESKEKQQILYLFFFEGYTAKEISQLLPVTANNVWVSCTRFRQKFMKNYKKE